MLTIKEVAARLGVSRQTVWRLTKQGLLPSYKIGGCRRYRETDVAAYLEAHRAGGNHARP